MTKKTIQFDDKCPTCGFMMANGNKYCSVACLPKSVRNRLKHRLKQ